MWISTVSPSSDRTPSRASPLPHWNAFNCGSGLAREGVFRRTTALLIGHPIFPNIGRLNTPPRRLLWSPPLPNW
ncbi:hypothetical protein E3Z29_18745 [Pseudomonas sp. S150]|nr:hypothetical protein E3Z29_18745 [Pseudomonas sp. S150]